MKSIFKFVSAAALAIGTLTGGVAQARTPCHLKVTEIFIAGDGGLWVSGKSDGVIFNHNALCNVAAPVERWTAESCKEAHKVLTTAMLSGRRATLWNTNPGAICIFSRDEHLFSHHEFYQVSMD